MNYSVQRLLESTNSYEFAQDRLRILIIGSAEWTTETIHTLHALGFAEVGEWSPLLPTQTSGEVMSILTRSRPR